MSPSTPQNIQAMGHSDGMHILISFVHKYTNTTCNTHNQPSLLHQTVTRLMNQILRHTKAPHQRLALLPFSYFARRATHDRPPGRRLTQFVSKGSSGVPFASQVGGSRGGNVFATCPGMSVIPTLLHLPLTPRGPDKPKTKPTKWQR